MRGGRARTGIWGLAAVLLACGTSPPPDPGAVATVADTTFAHLFTSLSEDGGYFDTDNLISNEMSYLHAVTALEELGVSGGVYLGVGPGQNFSYISAVRPTLAFIVDIRRDNALEHMLFKALFTIRDTRAGYLAALIGRETPQVIPASAGIDQIVEALEVSPVLDAEELAALSAQVRDVVTGFGVDLNEDDLATIARFHAEFYGNGLNLRFSSHYRAPQPYYPTLRRLLVERDRDGSQRSFVADEASFQYVRSMQLEERIIPVVGNLAGPKALQAIGRYLTEAGLEVSAFYTSNVEFYLMRDRSFERFAENASALPWAENGVFIRSYFNRFRASHPESVPGYASTQLIQPYTDFDAARREGRLTFYGALVFPGGRQR